MHSIPLRNYISNNREINFDIVVNRRLNGLVDLILIRVAMSCFRSRPMSLLTSAQDDEVSHDLYSHLEGLKLFEAVMAFKE
jgi:hypothetical protein